jgi:ribosome-associated protein
MTTEEAPRPLRLDHFLKRELLTESGGGAKHAIQSGLVQVNGVVETRRKRKLKAGDVVLFDGKERTVASE